MIYANFSSFIFGDNPRQNHINDKLCTYQYLHQIDVEMTNKLRNLEALEFLPQRMIAFASLIYPCLQWAKVTPLSPSYICTEKFFHIELVVWLWTYEIICTDEPMKIFWEYLKANCNMPMCLFKHSFGHANMLFIFVIIM